MIAKGLAKAFEPERRSGKSNSVADEIAKVCGEGCVSEFLLCVTEGCWEQHPFNDTRGMLLLLQTSCCCTVGFTSAWYLWTASPSTVMCVTGADYVCLVSVDRATFHIHICVTGAE